MLALARAMVWWHSRHRFCGVCGSPTLSEEAGHMRRCTNPECKAMHFPRTDPAVIMLVTDGERALLGRNKNFPPGMYSTFAGFVEPGESLEDAVAREVREETGIEVGQVIYHSSQPWPFPANIMLGFHAEAMSSEIAVDYGELEDAKWFERDWLLAHVDDNTFRLPRLEFDRPAAGRGLAARPRRDRCRLAQVDDRAGQRAEQQRRRTDHGDGEPRTAGLRVALVGDRVDHPADDPDKPDRSPPHTGDTSSTNSHSAGRNRTICSRVFC